METHEGFSIREYVSRMRSVDVLKCWPFDEDTSEESVISLLPPITVKKFTSWLDELEYLHSESSRNVGSSKGNMRRKKNKVQEKGESSLRSGVDLEESDVDAGDGMEVVKLKSRAKAPKKRSILEIFAVAPPVERRISSEDDDDDQQDEDGFYSHEKVNWGHKGKRNAKVKKKAQKNKEIITNKLKKSKKIIHKIKIKENCLVAELRDQDKAIGNPTENENDICDQVSISKKKSRLQHLIRDKTMACEDFKLTAENQQYQENPKRGILKNSSKGKCIVQEDDCGKRKAEKRVTFLQKDNTLRLIEDVSNGTETEVEPFSHSVTSDIIGDGKNQDLCDMGIREAQHDSQYACFPVFACMPCEVDYNSRNAKIMMNSSSSTGGRLIKDLGTSGSRVPPTCFKDYLRTYNEPSASNHYETLLSPRESLQTVFSPADRYQTGNVHGKRNIHDIDEGFVRLPLNSQGAMIRLSSSGEEDLTKMIRSSTAGAPPICLSLPSNTPFECFVERSDRRCWNWRTSSRDDQLKENPVPFSPSRLDIPESRGNGQTNLDFDLIKSIDHIDQVQKSPGNENILPTMRLMGKEFIVGRRGFQRFEDEHIWKDKQVMNDLRFNNTSFSSVTMHDQNELSVGKLKETLLSINHRSGSMCTFPHIDYQTSSMHERNCFMATAPGLSQGNCAAFHNSETLFPEPFPAGYKSQVIKPLELPTTHAAHQYSCPNMSASDIQLKKEQNVPRAPRSAIRFPFMHPDLEWHPRSSWSSSFHVNQPPLFGNVSKKGKLMSDFQPYNLGRGCNHPCEIPGTNQLIGSSVSLRPEALHLYNPFSSDSATQQGVLPSSPIQKSYGDQNKIREKITSRIGSRHLGHGRNTRRQASVVSSLSFQPVITPSLGIKEGSEHAITKPTNHVNFDDVQNIETALESCVSTNKSNVLMCDESRDDMNEQRIYPWIDSYSSAARSGPSPVDWWSKAYT